MFDQDYIGSTEHIDDLLEEQLDWMSHLNGALLDDDEDDGEAPAFKPEDDGDELPAFKRAEPDEPEPDDFVLTVRAWLAR